jgi:PKD repeat protein
MLFMNGPVIIFLACSVGLILTLNSCKKDPAANISADKTEVEINESIKFTNQSTNGVTYRWDFGDGETSTETDPVHAYTTAGDYTVSLTAYSKKEKSSNTYTLPVRVTDYAYKFSGMYTGISNYQSTSCGSGSASNNIQISASLTGNNFSLFNLDNKFTTLSGTVVGSSTQQYILPQTGIYANDGSQWDLDTVTLLLSDNTLIITYAMTDLPYGGTCGNYIATLQLEK